MIVTIEVLLAAVLATIGSHLLERALWPKRRQAILGSINTFLVVSAHLRSTLEEFRRADPRLDERVELALIDLSEQEYKLRRDRTVLQWT